MQIKKLITGMLMAGMFLPALALAEDLNTGKDENEKPIPTLFKKNTQKSSKKDFCANIVKIGEKADQKFADSENKRLYKKDLQEKKLSDRQLTIDQKRLENRAFVDKKHETNNGNMFGRVKTEAQKTALATYKTTLENATQTRRTAVDTAIKTFREATSTAIALRQTQVDALTATYKTAVTDAVLKAKTECANGISSVDAQKTYNTSVKDARVAMETGRKAIVENTSFETAKKVRNDAVKSAEEAFKVTMDAAKATLKAAMQ